MEGGRLDELGQHAYPKHSLGFESCVGVEGEEIFLPVFWISLEAVLKKSIKVFGFWIIMRI